MDGRVTKERLRKALAEDIERLLETAVAAVNQTQPGHIIDDSEEPVRDAAGRFRQKLFEKALELRSQCESHPIVGAQEQDFALLIRQLQQSAAHAVQLLSKDRPLFRQRCIAGRIRHVFQGRGRNIIGQRHRTYRHRPRVRNRRRASVR